MKFNRDLCTKLLVGAGLACAFALTLSSGAAAQRRHHADLPYSAPAQVTQKSLALGATPLVTVDNVTGPITVVGDGGNEVRFTATETVSGESQDAVAQGQRDVHLDVSQTGDSVKLFVDGPFRCGNQDNESSRCGDHWSWHWDNPGYEARFAFELHVPAGAKLELRTVNDGDVQVTGVTGDYQVHNVNGSVELDGAAGSGLVSTVNGSVKASYRSNPRAASQFSTINGEISLYLRAGLNADLLYRTLNGSVYSDYAVTPLATPAAAGERQGSMIVFRRGQNTRGRIGSGGPELTLRTLNGNIYLHEAK